MYHELQILTRDKKTFENNCFYITDLRTIEDVCDELDNPKMIDGKTQEYIIFEQTSNVNGLIEITIIYTVKINSIRKLIYRQTMR